MTDLNPPIDIASRRGDAAQLLRRLEDGYARIDEARRSGIDTRTWEDFWVKLLHEYEALCDELAEAA